MTSSRDESWAQVRRTEDLLALVAEIDERRRVIRIQAWHEGSWTAIYVEATAMQAPVSALREEIAACWARLHSAATGVDVTAEKARPEAATSGPAVDNGPG